jgi:hypothetical protein
VEVDATLILEGVDEFAGPVAGPEPGQSRTRRAGPGSLDR